MEEKNERVFVDSNYFIALFNGKDALAKNAQLVSKILDRRNSFLVISNVVFLEIMTITSMRASRQIAIEAGRSLLENPQIHIIHIDESLQQDTWDIFQETKNKNISFVDCSIIATMRSEGITKLLTFDTTDFAKLQKQYKFQLYK